MRGLAFADVVADLPGEADRFAVHGKGRAQPCLAEPGFQLGEPGGVAGGRGGRLGHQRGTDAALRRPAGGRPAVARDMGRPAGWAHGSLDSSKHCA